MRSDVLLGCDDALAAVLEDGGVVPFAARAHVRACPRCRRALERQRTLGGDLHQLGGSPVPGERGLVGDALLESILAALDLEDRRASRRARWIGVGAVAGAVAGGVAAGAVAVARGRRPALTI